MYFTYADAVEHGMNWLASNALDERGRSDARRSAIAALRELSEAHPWTHYITFGRLDLVAPYGTGTISSSGATVTLSGGVWPSWAGGGTLRVGEVVYEVRARTSDTAVVLMAAPAVAFPSGTVYQLFRDTYPLPDDWRQGDQAYRENLFGGIRYVHPSQYLEYLRQWGDWGTPAFYTVTTDIRHPGRHVARISPSPQEARTLDFVYRRSPRTLRFQSVTQGSLTVGLGSASVVGTSGVFSVAHIGAVIRIGATVDVPSAEWGLNPYAHETRVLAVADTNHLTLEEISPIAGSRLGYEISDPVDIGNASMLTAYQRALEWQMSLVRSLTDKPNPRAAWDRALSEAKYNDQVYSGPRSVEVPLEANVRYPSNLFYGSGTIVTPEE